MFWPFLTCHQTSGSTTKRRPATKPAPTSIVPSMAGNEKRRFSSDIDSTAAVVTIRGRTAAGEQASATGTVAASVLRSPVSGGSSLMGLGLPSYVRLRTAQDSWPRKPSSASVDRFEARQMPVGLTQPKAYVAESKCLVEGSEGKQQSN